MFKKLIIATGIGIVSIFILIGGYFGIEQNFGGAIPPPLQVIEWERPVGNAAWAEDVKKESLDVKFGYQLNQMEENLTTKLPRHQKDLDYITQCPECLKWELREQFENDFKNADLDLFGRFEGKTLQEWIDGEFAEQVASRNWEVDKITQSLERIVKEKSLRTSGFLKVIDRIPTGNSARNNIKSNERSPLGTDFFIDCVNGSAANTGLGTTSSTAYLDLDNFTEASRSAGDTVTVRRGDGTENCSNGSDLAFTSDGALANPIKILVDSRGLWPPDHASSSQTATLTFGSKTVTMSASTTGIVANDWLYAVGDDQDDFAYEVDSISSDVITLFLPYKGGQAGSGVTLNLMKANPRWGTAAGNFQWNFDSDNFWKVQGIHILGTDTNGNVELDSTGGHIFKDVIFEGNGGSDRGIRKTDDAGDFQVLKSRFFNYEQGILANGGSGQVWAFIKDSLFDGNNVGSSVGYSAVRGDNTIFEEIEFKNNSSGDVGAAGSPSTSVLFRGRNLLMSSNTQFDQGNFADFSNYFVEDFQGVIGDSFQFLGLTTVEDQQLIRSTTTPVRSGGGATSIEVLPSTNLSSNWELSQIQLFEYPIHTDTTSRDYQVFFRSGDGTPFTTSPTADELWIECEYWADASNNFRRLLKSTGTVDFTTDADFDQSLTITCNPAQTGILYLRGWYAKTKEADTNIFFVDPRPVITTT